MARPKPRLIPSKEIKLRKFLALLLVLFFIIIAPPAIYAFNFSRTLLNPDLYKSTFEETSFYTRLGPLIADLFIADLAKESRLESGLAALAEEELETVVAGIILPAWLKGEMEKNVDIFFAWLDKGNNLPEIAFDLMPLKAELAEAMPQLAYVFFAARWEEIPLCAAGEISTFDEDDNPSCRPEGITAQDFFESQAGGEVVDEETEEFLADIPDTLTIRCIIVGEARGREALEKLEQATENFRDFRNSLLTLRAAGIVLPILSLLTFIALVALSATSLRSLLAWGGTGLLVAGLLALLPALFVSGIAALFGQALSGALADAGASYGGTELVRSLVEKITGAAMSPIQQQGLVMSGLGLTAIVGAVMLRMMRSNTA